MKKLLKRVISMVLTLVILLSVVPLTTFFTTVSAITTAELNGTFESDTVGQTPHGWTLISTNGDGLPTDINYLPAYVLSVSNDKMSGTKSMSIAAKDAGIKGYVTAESEKITVEGGKTYEIPDFHREECRVQYENDRLTPFYGSDGSEPNIPCCSVPDYRPSEKQMALYREMLEN